MSQSHPNDDKLARLFDDVLSSDEVTPEQLVQYAEKPESLSTEDRAFIEAQIAASPALADQLRVLKNFSLPIAHAHAHTHLHHHHKQQTSLLQQLSENIGKLFGNMLIPVGAMAVIALSVTMVLFMDKTDTTTPSLADNSTESGDTTKPVQQLTNDTTQQQTEVLVDTTPAPAIDDKPTPVQDEPDQPEATMMLAMVEPQFISGYGYDQQIVIRGDTTEVICLAPSMANTSTAQPLLYWSLSTIESSAKLQLEISNEETGEILVSESLNMPANPGMQEISLSELNVRLAENTTYQWILILQPDANNPALDKFASAKIKYIKPDTAFVNALKNAKDSNKANLYASKGYWYEALNEVITMKERHPDNDSIQKAYKSLLAQAGIKQ